MKITFIRHGETEYNRQKRIQGKSNIMLNDVGRRMVHHLKDKIKEEHYDICFTSPLISAMETAMILVGDRVEIVRDSRLIERNLGNIEGKTIEYYDPKKYWDYSLNCGDEGVEKIKDLFQRCEEFITFLEKNYENKSILIVSHGATIRVFHHILRHTDLNSDLLDFKIENCYMEKIDLTK